MEREADLYPHVKAYLQAQGYTVKGEIGAADLVAVRRDEDPVIVELKLRVTLTLYHQAVTRLRMTDLVYIAVPKPKGRKALRENTILCRRLGLGFLTVRRDGTVEAQCDPGPYAPRQTKTKRDKLLREFHRLKGDPNDGGATRHGIVTAYRQDALRCAMYLAEAGAEKGSIVARATGVETATTLMRDNHYGWFRKVETGVYDLTPQGRQGLVDWGDSLG
ncbi:MAG: DUF2161 domain-containing phosphodiesterase [Marivita sp.]|uniref:DUF2161 domain-containing phosphodiesterase n=1 Tax=Marivita sp. TaxID=2003365 RepID=UPI003EF95818